MSYMRRLHSKMNCMSCYFYDRPTEKEPQGHCLKTGRTPMPLELDYGCSWYRNGVPKYKYKATLEVVK